MGAEVDGIWQYDTGDGPPLPAVLNLLGDSVRDKFAPYADSIVIKKVADVTARSAYVATLGTISASNPAFVYREDADDGVQVEYTTDGSTWFVLDGRTASSALSVVGVGGYATASSDAKTRIVYSGGLRFLTGQGYVQKDSGNFTRNVNICRINALHYPDSTQHISIVLGNGSGNLGVSRGTLDTSGYIKLLGDDTSLGSHNIIRLNDLWVRLDDDPA